VHVLITGGAGFIGSNLAEYHLLLGDSVCVIDNLSTGSLDNIHPLLANPAFLFNEADILTWDGLKNSIARANRVYHLAAIVGVKKVLADPVAVMATNIAGTERVLRAIHACQRNPQVVIASSSEVYGFNTKDSFSETDDVVLRSGGQLRWCYAATKLADEFLAFAYARKYGLRILIARLFNTIGPRQTGRYGMVVPTFIKQAITGAPLTVYGTGNQTRSFCDVRDMVVELDLLASLPDLKGEIVNVGNDREITIKDLARLVLQRANSDAPITYVPYAEAYGIEFEDVTHRRPELTKFFELTGFIPKWDLVRTIDDLILREQEQQNFCCKIIEA